jgi:hypothetical protein
MTWTADHPVAQRAGSRVETVRSAHVPPQSFVPPVPAYPR